MSYFVTGATGFIGRYLTALLLQRKATVYALIRPGSGEKLHQLRTTLGVDETQLVGIEGDLSQDDLGISDSDFARLTKIKHFFHLAAIYDLKADAESQHNANVHGTRQAVAAANRGPFTD